ncbi:hypothetical protein Tco_1477507 [Tanacetum coccineum]
MEAEFQTETDSSQPVHALSPVVEDSDHIIHMSSSEGVVTNHILIQFTSSNSIISGQVEEPDVEVDTRRSTLEI